MTELSKTYDPKTIESKWYAQWLEKKFFHSDPSRGGEPYCIVIPPPNITGILHMGHALNNTIQDVLTRWRRMQGRNAVWVPGTDHAGIATQNVVERQLKKDGKTRQDLGREVFIERVWDWQKQYGSTIVNQLKSLGASCDWDRERFTMDEGLSNAVTEVFIRLHDKGLIYRGNYIINWCPRCQTALSDEESEHRDVKGHLYHLRYPIKDAPGRYVVVATTRPETFLGDTAVAVNPKDERYQDLIGKKLLLPILNREIPVIADDFVDPKFGTGCVKVTPAHDPNDFAMGQRHHLPQINVMTDDGHMNKEAGPYEGQERFACRNHVIKDLEGLGLIEKIEDHQHAVGHCYRCHTVVEPRLSLQWFVKMKPLAQPALKAVQDGRIKFVPERWNKVYIDWMENIRDWCISRQIWWGHRIPVWYCDKGCAPIVVKTAPQKCPTCGSVHLKQDDDVLDTWFSSWLWPFSVWGWPLDSARDKPEVNQDLTFYYPTNTLVTASEIIFFWVARMIMAGMEFMGEIPFSEVYIHGTVRDNSGRKMSKSLGNSIDPLTIIDKFSADALRYSLLAITATGQDVYLSEDKFEIGRNFGTKIWNAARFMQMHKTEQPINVKALVLSPEKWSPDDWHIVAKLEDAAKAADDCLVRFRFNDYALVIYEFLWHEFCDWYVEYAKNVLYGQDEARRHEVLKVMHYVFSRAIRLLHPLMPFLTEELWHGMGYGDDNETIMYAEWPVAKDSLLRNMAVPHVEYVDKKHELIRTGRTLRADYEIPPGQKVDFVIKPASVEDVSKLEKDSAFIGLLLKAATLKVDSTFVPSQTMPSAISALGNIYMSLGAEVNAEAEIKKFSEQRAKLDEAINGVTKKLQNQDFVQKAKPEVVEQQQVRLQELNERRDKLTRLIEGLRPKA